VSSLAEAPPKASNPIAATQVTSQATSASQVSELPPPAPAKASNPAAATGIHRPSLRNTCGQYVREQLLSFSQPSDNRLSMKHALAALQQRLDRSRSRAGFGLGWVQ